MHYNIYASSRDSSLFSRINWRREIRPSQILVLTRNLAEMEVSETAEKLRQAEGLLGISFDKMIEENKLFWQIPVQGLSRCQGIFYCPPQDGSIVGVRYVDVGTNHPVCSNPQSQNAKQIQEALQNFGVVSFGMTDSFDVIEFGGFRLSISGARIPKGKS